MQITLTGIFEPNESGGYTVHSPAIQGAVSQGVTMAGAAENLVDAIRELLAHRESQFMPAPGANIIPFELPLTIAITLPEG